MKLLGILIFITTALVLILMLSTKVQGGPASGWKARAGGCLEDCNCPYEYICHASKCIDACVICKNNSSCYYIAPHKAACACDAHHEGNPYIECKKARDRLRK